MKNVKGTVIGAFSIVIVISLLSSAISFFGYTKVIESVNSIQINKANQDKIQELGELSAKRQQILTQSVVYMNDDGNKEFDQIGKNIDDIAKKLAKADISIPDAKTVEELITINNKYNDMYISTMADDIKAFDKKNIPEFSKSAQSIFVDIQKTQNELKTALTKSLETRIDNSINDIINLNRRVGLIYSDSQYIDSTFIEIKNLLAEVLTQIQGSGAENAMPAEEFSQKIEDLKQKIETAANSAQMNLENSQPNGFDRVFNIKKISSELQDYEKINELIAFTYENNSDIMYSASTFEDTSANFKENNASIDQILGDLEKSGSNKEKIDGLVSQHSSYNGVAEEIYKRTAIMKKAAITNGFISMTEMNKAFSDNINKLRMSFNSYFDDNIKASENIKKAIFWIFVGVTAFSIVVGMLIALLLSRKIEHPISSLVTMLARVEKGDLTVRADIKSNGEIGGLGKKVNSVLDGQQRMAEQFRDTTDGISDLKQRLIILVKQNRESGNKISNYKKAESALENRALDTESILADVRTVSEQTQKAVGDSMRAIKIAKSREKEVEEAGIVINTVNETVKSVAASISKLESSSGKIGEITNTITQIASQTNLLALNAAIEANRAGKQGNGFAVVANEIRKLSNASNQSAAEIKMQIKEIQANINFAVEKMNLGVVGVENGASRINEVKEGIAEIIESVNLVVGAIKSSADKASTHYESTMQFVEAVDCMSKSLCETSATTNGLDDSIALQARTLIDLDQISQLLNEASDELKNISSKVKI
ncbi:MAG TPA: HAMP domain-containing methyl-accepting chemotaxis protein [Ruminiclostridium sp.]